MGCADVVPGVSGGTVALILGIYERLVSAIGNFDVTLVRQLKQGHWREAAAHVDLRFLMMLGGGLGSGVVAMSLIVNRLLADPLARSLTFASFSGMILASSLLIALMIRPTGRDRIYSPVLGLAGIAMAWWVSTLVPAGTTGPPGYLWLFACGSLAICAMILPGISGALILLVLGVYAHLTEVPHNLLHGEAPMQNLLVLTVFGCGCGLGLLLFSKVLKWLLTHHHALTMSLLCGFMLGALRKLWPFQRDLTPEIEKFKHKQFELVWPESLDGPCLAVLLAAGLAIAGVLATDWFVRRARQPVDA